MAAYFNCKSFDLHQHWAGDHFFFFSSPFHTAIVIPEWQFGHCFPLKLLIVNVLVYMRLCAHFIRSNNNWSKEHSVHFVHMVYAWHNLSVPYTNSVLHQIVAFDCTFEFNFRFIEINKFRQKETKKQRNSFQQQTRKKKYAKLWEKAIWVNRQTN